MFRKISPQDVSTGTFHGYLLGLVAPRPIAFASTVDAQGNINLSPFSFFNVFGSCPPVLIFSPARRVRDNTTKHTLENILETSEVVVNIGSYDIIEQMSLASTEYEQGVNEFVKAGLTASPSELIKPPRVAEAVAAFECKVLEVKAIGLSGGSANLVICEILLLHMQENLFDLNGNIDPLRFEAVSRLGEDWYSKIIPESLFRLPKPNSKKAIGFDQLSEFVKEISLLTQNNLARLANIEQLPTPAEIAAFLETPLIQYIYSKHKENPPFLKKELQALAKKMIELNKVTKAWNILLLTKDLPEL